MCNNKVSLTQPVESILVLKDEERREQTKTESKKPIFLYIVKFLQTHDEAIGLELSGAY